MYCVWCLLKCCLFCTHTLPWFLGVLDDVSESYLQDDLCWMGSATHCLWLPLKMHLNVEGEIADPPVTIPCGMQEHLGLVSFFTILIATICSVYIIYYLPVPTLDDHKHK